MKERRAKLALCETAFGWLGMALSDAGLCRLTLPKKTKREAEAELLGSFPEGEWGAEGGMGELAERLRRYFSGEPVDFTDSALDLSRATPFQRAVWDACRAIPRGEVRSYRELAQAVGSPRGSRAVGQAMAANPIPILIPCHRVVGSDGSLTGFGGGLAMKARLLKLEGR